MKKLLITFSLMLMFIASLGTVFAATVKVKDDAYYLKGTANEGYAILEGNENDVTGRVSNVTKSCTYKGNTYVAWANYKVSTYYASVDAVFHYNNAAVKTEHLSI